MLLPFPEIVMDLVLLVVGVGGGGWDAGAMSVCCGARTGMGAMTTVGCAASTVCVAYVLCPLWIFCESASILSCTLCCASCNLPTMKFCSLPCSRPRAAAELTEGSKVEQLMAPQEGWRETEVRCGSAQACSARMQHSAASSAVQVQW